MKANFLGISLDITNTNETLDKCREYLDSNSPNTIFFINAHCFNIASKNKTYHSALNKATLLLNDGIGIKLATLLDGITVKENMNGTDLIPKIIQLAHEKKKKLYILGSEDKYLTQAICNLKAQYGDDLIVGYHSGFFNKEEETKIIEEITNRKVDLLIIGMGVPKQEIWINDHLNEMNNVKMIVAGGAIIDFIAGKFPRAPKFLQVTGLEWFYRFINEPKRLFKRYIIGNFTFLVRILYLIIHRNFLKFSKKSNTIRRLN